MPNYSSREVEKKEGVLLALTDIFYKPFGESESDTGTQSVNHKFTGQELDGETALYNYNARLYDPVVGKFVSADTMVPQPKYSQDFNRYAYVKNNPLKYTDPTGHWGSCGNSYGGDLGGEVDPNDPDAYNDPTPEDTYDGGYGWDEDGEWGDLHGYPSDNRGNVIQADITYINGRKYATVTVPSINPTVNAIGLVSFDFNQFANEIEDRRFDLSATLGTLTMTLGIGTMPKTPSELRGFGPRDQLNPYTSQLSRLSMRTGNRFYRDLGRSRSGILISGAATALTVFEGFYNWSVIAQAAYHATTFDEPSRNN